MVRKLGSSFLTDFALVCDLYGPSGWILNVMTEVSGAETWECNGWAD